LDAVVNAGLVRGVGLSKFWGVRLDDAMRTA
jgi:hypothetical protein